MVPIPTMTLADYLARNALSVDDFAHEVGINAVSVRRYMAGARLPRRKILQRIMEATSGAVTPNDFVQPEFRKKPGRRLRGPTCVAA
jgi:hypothetical protein